MLEKITVEDISKQANVSPFHFQRTFTLLTDITVGEYLRRRRLTLAAEELCRTDSKIIDLAFKYGYDTPESFSKAFRRQHGVAPLEARRSKERLNSYNRLVIQVSLKGAEPMKYSIVEKEAFQIVGIRRQFACVDEDENVAGIPEFWGEVHANGLDDKLFQLNNGEIKGVLGVCDSTIFDFEGKKFFHYWIATEVKGQLPKELPENFRNYEIPSSKWAIFEVHGPMPEAMQKTWKQIFSEWFPSNGYEPAGTPELEVYSNQNPSDSELYSEIWIPIK
ncbi:AraC family transcriptional regulator [Bacillus horti]